jgi:hypothetical protein
MPFGIVAKHARRTGDLLAEAVWARDRVLKREGLGPKDQVANDRRPPAVSGQTRRPARHGQRRE